MSRSITPNPVSSQAITVSSTAGFNAGDLVYFNGSTGDYGTPPVSAAGSSVSVPGLGPTPILSGVVGASITDVGIYGACATTGFAAILTNNNIVQVYIKASTSTPMFRIVDAAGTIVVAETTISATFTQGGTPNIAVTALTGGGFTVAWINSSGGTVNKPCYAVYSNTGTVVTAAQQDTGGGLGGATAKIRIKATPTGGFIIAYPEVNAATWARGYSATGVAAFAWVNLPSTGVGFLVGLAVRNDGSFLLAGGVNSGSQLYGIWSSTGTPIVSSTSFTSTNGTFLSNLTDAACLSNGTTFVIVYAASIGGNSTTAFRFLPTGNVLGSEFYVPNTNFLNGTNSYQYNQDVTALSDNRFIIGMISGANTYSLCYAVFNSSGVCLSGTVGTTSTGASPIVISQTYSPYQNNNMSVIEAPVGYLTLYYGNGTRYSFMSSKVDATTYALINPLPTTQNAGNASAGPIAYAPAGSNPLGAAYSISAGTYNTFGTYGAVIKNPEQIASSVYGVSTTTLPDGRVLVAYMLSSAEVKVAVYSVTGVFIETINVATNGYASFQGWSNVTIAALTSGKFVIAYASTNTLYRIKLYSSTFTQIGSDISVTNNASGGYDNSYVVSVAGITNDRYVVVYPDSSGFPYYQVYSSANASLAGPINIVAATFRNMTVGGFSQGGFFFAGRTVSNIQQYYTFNNISGDSFANVISGNAATGVAQETVMARAVSNTYGGVLIPAATSSTSAAGYTFNIEGNGVQTQATLSSISNLNSVSAGFTGSGIPVLTGVTSGVMYIDSPRTNDTALALNSTLFQPTSNCQICITPSYAGNIGMAFIDTTQTLRYAIVCGTSMPVPIALTSANPSNPIAIYPGATSATPAIQNTIFAGVALQTVPPGGAGLVQVNGTAQLGSTYPAGTTYRAFDHQSQGVPGVKGTITGRTITLQGNT
jgi:hypothetical protein